MNILLICLIITGCIVYIWDFAQFPLTIANNIASKATHGKITNVELKKPFGCSGCLSFWTTLIILAIFNWKLIPFALLFNWAAKYIGYCYIIIDKIISKCFVFMERIIK